MRAGEDRGGGGTRGDRGTSCRVVAREDETWWTWRKNRQRRTPFRAIRHGSKKAADETWRGGAGPVNGAASNVRVSAKAA